jgi:nucleoside-diphosphate-sugar epimerase
MTDALIGYSGFIGGHLERQHAFGARYHSHDIGSIAGRSFDVVVCAGAPGTRWIANRDPDADRASIARLMAALTGMTCRRFLLVSTVDVFGDPVKVDEQSAIDVARATPYGRHRRELEEFAASRFPGALIVRLPALVGAGLRKNVLFDLLNDNALDAIDCRSIYQFYPVANLWRDIEIALASDLRVLHLTAEPLSVTEVAREGFGCEFTRTGAGPPARYDFRSRNAACFGARGNYQYTREQSLEAVRLYARTEPRRT